MKFMISSLSIVLCATLAPAATMPDLSMSYWEHGLTADAGICVCPAGDGQSLAAMQSRNGVVDGTITVYVITEYGNPVYDFPHEDIWLEAPGLNSCGGGTMADASTDFEGRTTISRSPAFGGIQSGDLIVMINGTPCANTPDGANLYHLTSPDLDGNGAVGLSDVVLLVQKLEAGVYDTSVDFDYDGVLTLSDVVVFAEHLQHVCR